MRKLFSQFEHYIDMLTLRERLLLSAVVLLVIFFLWLTFLWRPLFSKRVGLLTQYSTTVIALNAGQKELQVVQYQFKTTTQQKSSSQQKTTAYESQSELERLLSEYERSIISPQTMKETLQNILGERQDLELLQLKVLPAASIANVGSSVLLYQFGFMLKVKGTYFSTLHFLEDIEKLDWRIYWNKFNYTVEKYPYGEVTIELHTIGTREG